MSGYVCLALTIVFVPLVMLYVYTRELPRYFNKYFNMRWGVLLEDLKVRDRMSSMYYLVYVIRRILFVYIVFYID